MEPASFLTIARRAPARGFTLVEMLVVLAIIGVVSAIVFTGENNFNRSFFLTNTAYDVALSLHQAQVYGVSTQGYVETQNAGYGIYISNASPASYLMFADTYPSVAAKYGANATPASHSGNNLYDSAQNELVQQFALGNGFVISNFCVSVGTSDPTCYTPAENPQEALSIVFARPNEDAVINAVDAGGAATAATSACFTISDSVGDSRYISITQTGQIAVASSCGSGLQGGSGGSLGDALPAPSCNLQTLPSTSINQGDSIQILWTTLNASAAAIDQGIGSVPVGTGSTTTKPSSSVTYHMSVTGQGGNGSCSVPVTVVATPAPTCTLIASPSSVTSGGSVGLNWTSQNATSISIDQGVGAVTPTASSTAPKLVYPTSNPTTYTATVTGAGGSGTCQALVTVNSGSQGTSGTIFLTSGSSWSVPSDWNNSANTIEVIGSGGDNSSSGGGGGAYAKKSNVSLTPGGSVSYQVGNISVNNGDTWFSSTATVLAKGASGGTGGAASASVGDVKYSGGNGVFGSGGGAAGPNGAGGTGAGANNIAGAGDAGHGGAGASGFANGGNGTEWDATHGSGGGGGAAASAGGGSGGLYGGGGSNNYGDGAGTGASAPGLIVITYTPTTGGGGRVMPF